MSGPINGGPSDGGSPLAASEALHARVRELARAALAGAPSAQSFEALALDIARFQAERQPAFARLCRHHGRPLDRLEHVPAVPADVFRLARVAAHEPALDVAAFQTSGTTGGAGRHFFRTLDTYAELCVSWGRRALLGPAAPTSGEGPRSSGEGPRCTVLALAPPFEPERRSSLGFMLQRFMQELDGRSLGGGPFDPREPGRWLIGAGQVDLAGLERSVGVAQARAEPVLLLATAFALVWLLDALGGAALPLPARSVVMVTGGFKGRARSVDGHELGLAVCRALGVEARSVIGEYGMTELSSQLYDRGFDAGGRQPSVFVEPPWLRITPVDPVTLEPVASGEAGLACFTDLGNVDSALRVLTQDRVRREAEGIVLLGRQPGARLRGCSLGIEALAPAAGLRARPPRTLGGSS